MRSCLPIIRILIVALGIGMLGGCAASKVAEGRPGVNLSQVVPGSTRAQVEAVLGAPVREWTTPVGIRYRLYSYDAGVPPNPDQAVLAGIFDVLMLGSLSAAAALDDRGGLGPSQQSLLAVSYGADDRVKGVFKDITEFSPLPDDGLARPNGKK